MKRIPLTNGYQAVVDDDWYPFLNTHWWAAKKVGKHLYAARKKRIDGKAITIYMHKIITGVPNNFRVLHLDGDPLNFQFDNLVVLNGTIIDAKAGVGESRYRGVVWNTVHGLWAARLADIDVGYFQTEHEAAMCYNKKIRQIAGPGAELNVIPEGFIRS